MEDAHDHERPAPAITTIAFFGLKTTVLLREALPEWPKCITKAAFGLEA
ncbi:hypothetical protein [uncultured Adlercreutzia sp.]|nr:hypothetical protein [uncultured Adlercreutzia sp.]